MTHRLRVTATLLVLCALAACGTQTPAPAPAPTVAARTYPDVLTLTTAAALALGPCETPALSHEVTGVPYRDCAVSEFSGVTARFLVYPSANQARHGSEYYAGRGPFHQEGNWLVVVNGDQPALESITEALHVK